MDCNVAYLITTYNRQKSLKKLVDRLEGDVYIIDDGSKPRVKLDANIIYQDNLGKEGYYITVTRLWNMVKDKHYDYYFLLQDDILPVDCFLEKALKTWININDYDKICLNLYVDQGRYMRPCWTGFQPVDHGNYIHSQWVDMCAIFCESEFFEALNWMAMRTFRDWDKNPELGSGVGSYISRKLHTRGYGLYQMKESLFTVQEEGYISKMNVTDKESLIYKTI